MGSTRFALEVRPQIPPALAGLQELSEDLLYGWDRDVQRVFRLLDDDLYERCGGNPKVLLRRVAQARLVHFSVRARGRGLCRGRLIQGVLVNHEIDFFEVRMATLANVTDVFLVQESNFTTFGTSKELHFLEKYAISNLLQSRSGH